jgi:hypothetical protein
VSGCRAYAQRRTVESMGPTFAFLIETALAAGPASPFRSNGGAKAQLRV